MERRLNRCGGVERGRPVQAASMVILPDSGGRATAACQTSKPAGWNTRIDEALEFDVLGSWPS